MPPIHTSDIIYAVLLFAALFISLSITTWTENTMPTIDNTILINALRAIINEEINKRMEQIENSHFDIQEHRDDIEYMIADYIRDNVTIEVG